MNFLVMPIFFLSGALFPLTNLPKVMSAIASLDPLTGGVGGLRGALNGAADGHFSAPLDLACFPSSPQACLRRAGICSQGFSF